MSSGTVVAGEAPRTSRIFNIGLNRAATTSLTEALRILGFRSAHFKVDDRRIHDLIRANVDAGRRPLTGLDHRFDAFSDFAATPFAGLLDQYYPRSKFIVTLREMGSWLDSRERKVAQNRADPNYRYAFTQVDRPGWARQRQRFLAAVEVYFRGRPDDLLMMDIPAGDGWDRLCPFLGCEVPDVAFPWLKRRADS